MTVVRLPAVVAAVQSRFPADDSDLLTEAVWRAAGSDVALAHIEKHLAVHPDALTSGHSSAPPPVVRLITELQRIGMDATSPVCGKCGQVKRLPYKVGEGRWCVTCYSHTRTAVCVSCGKDRMVAARTQEGPVCGNCLRYSKPETCVSCGHLRPVSSRSEDGPRCQACTARPERECSQCGQRRPVQAMVDGLPVCRSCYQQPQRECGVCGQVERIIVAATYTTPDVCARCYEKPLKACPDCGVREPCEHDSEFYRRPGNEKVGVLEPEFLARRRRMVPRPEHECARCGRQRPAQALWPIGPVCSGCYDAVLHHPRECPACGKQAALIGRIDDEAVCGPCAGSDRTYACRGCAVPCRAVADGLCARCYAQGEFDRILADASDEWAPLRTVPQETDSPVALVAWLRRSRGAGLLTDLVAAGRPPSHADLPAGKAEHYLRSLLVEVDVLDARSEPLERLPEWVDALVADDPVDVQQVLRRFAQWHVLRRARNRSPRRAFTESSGKWARQQIAVARQFLFWLADHDTALEDCSQRHIDLWLASGNTRRYLIRDFISWAKKDRLVSRTITIPSRSVKRPTAPTDEAARWDLLRVLLTDANTPDEVRVAGILVLVYGQHLSRVVTLTPDAVVINEDMCFITVADTPLPLPTTLAEPLRRMAKHTQRGKSAVARPTAAQRWLFPGGNPGHHITAEHMRTRLAEHGITLREARHAALLQWAQDTPGSILATSLGLHINTAIAWRDSIQGDFAEFVASRARASTPLRSDA